MNAIGTQLRDPINLGLTRWRLAVWNIILDAAAEIGKSGGIPYVSTTGLPNPSREAKFSGANADREIFIFPVQLTTCRIGNLTRLRYSCYM